MARHSDWRQRRGARPRRLHDTCDERDTVQNTDTVACNRITSNRCTSDVCTTHSAYARASVWAPRSQGCCCHAPCPAPAWKSPCPARQTLTSQCDVERAQLPRHTAVDTAALTRHSRLRLMLRVSLAASPWTPLWASRSLPAQRVSDTRCYAPCALTPQDTLRHAPARSTNVTLPCFV
jgi:hypothetical protein